MKVFEKFCSDPHEKQFTSDLFYAKITKVIKIKATEGVNIVPNIKSAKKRVLVTEKKTKENKMIKSALKTSIKKFLTAVNAGDKETATALYPETVSAIDSAASKGILHKNNAANKKAKLAKKLAAIA